jgi:hypothetical protein
MASFSTMAEQPDETTEQKPLSHPAQDAENLDDLLAALTIEEYLKITAKKLPQVDKNKLSGGSLQCGTQLRSRGRAEFRRFERSP